MAKPRESADRWRAPSTYEPSAQFGRLGQLRQASVFTSRNGAAGACTVHGPWAGTFCGPGRFTTLVVKRPSGHDRDHAALSARPASPDATPKTKGPPSTFRHTTFVPGGSPRGHPCGHFGSPARPHGRASGSCRLGTLPLADGRDAGGGGPRGSREMSVACVPRAAASGCPGMSSGA